MRRNREIVLAAVLPLLPAVSLLAPGAPSSPPLPRGPGAVIESARQFLAAVDAGDAAALKNLWRPLADGEGYECTLADGGAQQRTDSKGPIVFQDVAADGSAIAARSPDEAVGLLVARVAGKGRAVESRLLSARADCPSEHCSWASIEFERTVHGPDGVTTTPMRATVLAKYGDEAPHMRLFLWHASPTGPARPAASGGGGGGKKAGTAR